MDRSEGVLDALNALLQSWTAEHSLGNVTYGEKNADAGGVVWTLLNDMKEVSKGWLTPTTP